MYKRYLVGIFIVAVAALAQPLIPFSNETVPINYVGAHSIGKSDSFYQRVSADEKTIELKDKGFPLQVIDESHIDQTFGNLVYVEFDWGAFIVNVALLSAIPLVLVVKYVEVQSSKKK